MTYDPSDERNMILLTENFLHTRIAPVPWGLTELTSYPFPQLATTFFYWSPDSFILTLILSPLTRFFH